MNTSQKPKNRIRELREAKSWSQAQLAKSITPPTSQTQIDRLEKGERRLTTDWLEKLAAALSCHPTELYQPFRNVTDATAALQDTIAAMKPGARKDGARGPSLDNVTDALSKFREMGGAWAHMHEVAKHNLEPIWAVPVREIDVRGGMGGGGEAEQVVTTDGQGNTHLADAILGYWGLPAAYVTQELRAKPDALRIIEVQGDSMTPTLSPGDRVAINIADRRPSPPGIFALWDGLGVIVKRVEVMIGLTPMRFRVISDNTHHPSVEMTEDDLQVIGRVVWVARRL